MTLPVIAYTDGSCRPCQNGTGVAAFTILDRTGTIIAQEAVAPFQSANVAVAEMVAIHAAMDWLLAHGHYNVCIRTDHLPVIRALKHDTTFGGAIERHWIAIREWLVCFDRIDFEFVPRTTPEIQVCNHVANMARRQYGTRGAAA